MKKVLIILVAFIVSSSLAWEQLYETTAYEIANSIVSGPDGSFILAGTTGHMYPAWYDVHIMGVSIRLAIPCGPEHTAIQPMIITKQHIQWNRPRTGIIYYRVIIK